MRRCRDRRCAGCRGRRARRLRWFETPKAASLACARLELCQLHPLGESDSATPRALKISRVETDTKSNCYTVHRRHPPSGRASATPRAEFRFRPRWADKPGHRPGVPSPVGTLDADPRSHLPRCRKNQETFALTPGYGWDHHTSPNPSEAEGVAVWCRQPGSIGVAASAWQCCSSGGAAVA